MQASNEKIPVLPKRATKIPVKDIRNTPAAKHLERFFDSICAGNRGDAKIEKMQLDGSTVSYGVELRHWQVWDSPFGRVTVYSLTNHVKGSFDLKDPSTWKNQKVCTSSPVGDICFTLDQLVEVLIVVLA